MSPNNNKVLTSAGSFVMGTNNLPDLCVSTWRKSQEVCYIGTGFGIMLLLLLLSRFSRVWLCDPIDGSLPGSPVPGILKARTLEWVAISFSNAWKWKVKVKLLSHVRLFATPWTAAHQAPPPMGFSRQEYWSGVPLPSAHICPMTQQFCFLVTSQKKLKHTSMKSCIQMFRVASFIIAWRDLETV